jgi:hypothetical protein
MKMKPKSHLPLKQNNDTLYTNENIELNILFFNKFEALKINIKDIAQYILQDD